MLLIDSHCHIDQLNYDLLHKNIDDVLNKAYKNHIKKFLTVSTSIKNFYIIQNMFKNYKSILYSCGIHPLNCHQKKNHINQLLRLSNTNKVIALGETGLDYHLTQENKKIQQDCFYKHIKIAINLNKPIIVHSRNAIKDTLLILKEHSHYRCRGVLHSFTEDYSIASQLLDLGFYISFSGISTFKNSIILRETIKKIPLDRILIETDSPYLAPVPYRGQENQPAYLLEIAKNISILKKINIESVAYNTTKNFYTLFNI
ncbi:TatD family hydrolase [Buchnera aphidicola]|uniref:TatD family hydrolase n=1 Tax=Buchnera aphidicola TaxID=9 RepID=UPI003BEEB58C